MIIDNVNENKKLYEYIKQYTENGEMDIVTGYFTIGALAFISQQINDKIKAFRMVLGDVVNIDVIRDRTIDLLNENITIEAALKLSETAKEAVRFLKQDKVIAKTLEPNFCHAKLYLFHHEKDERLKYFISGSSNLTEAGIGLKHTSNVELNLAETGDGHQYKELANWFNDLWKKKQAHNDKTIIDEAGNKTIKPFKEYLIETIEQIFIKYTPKDLYYKVLFELFGSQLIENTDNPEFNRQIGKLENTIIYNTLYEFQQKGVLSLIKMLQKYNGAILADAVGLGKTWSALAVMKFFQIQGYEIILICPKKLEYNWKRFKKHLGSKFEKDQFDFFIRFHTDLHKERMEKYKYKDRNDKFFRNDKPKLFVIDESHNLRNSKSQRYKFLVEEILKQNDNIKVLMLSATPINNTFIDIRNQFKLIIKGTEDGFYESHGITNIDYTFRYVQGIFNEWKENINPKISEFIQKLKNTSFFKLTDSLIVARTRKMIENQKTNLHFPKKYKPENIFVTPKNIGNYENFEELFDHFPPLLSGYQPSFYIEQKENINLLQDDRLRDRFLVKMINILLVKRLESSWFSFHSTIRKVLEHHQNALDIIKQYERNQSKKKIEDTIEIELFSDDELEDIADEFTLGKKRVVSISEIEKAGRLSSYKKHLKKDIEALDALNQNLNRFDIEIKNEIKITNNHKSKDTKLESLIKKIKEKNRKDNPKVLIFTVYKDTAFYLFDQLTSRGFKNIAAVSGDTAKTDSEKGETKDFETILDRFAPYTKLFVEKEWDFFPSSEKMSIHMKYEEWQKWIADNDKETNEKLQKPIDILIATDVLSEGQNLQDCDMVINYDIHWNPVRIIQRMGRIDRLGSPNSEIYGINFWPSENINKYLNLKGRVEQKMAIMTLAGSEVQKDFSDKFSEMVSDEKFEDSMNEKMLRQMQISWDDIEDHASTLGFDDLSLESFRQDLYNEELKDKNKYKNMPNGVYTGFKAKQKICSEKGIIALLGYPARPPKTLEYKYKTYDLIYIDMNGKMVLVNQKEILDALSFHKDFQRYIPPKVDNGDEEAIKDLVNAVNRWIRSQSYEEEVLEDGTIKKRAGQETLNILEKLRSGDPAGIKRIKQNLKVEEKYNPANFDLITWFLISEE